MERHIIYHPVTVAVLLLVCLAAGGLVARAADPNQGTPRVMYTTDYVPGTRVVLLDEQLADAPELKAGMSGTIICCDKSDCSSRILVSWSLWRGGRNEEASCVSELAGLYPDGSTIWVDPSKVRLGLPFDANGVLRGGDDDCLYFAASTGGRYRLIVGPEFRKQWWVAVPGAFLRVHGLLNTTIPAADNTCAAADGDIYHPILTPQSWDMTPGSWSTGPFYPGDRVVLVGESNPYNAADLPRGTAGTVICHNSFAKTQSILVSWDLWTKGGNADDYLNCTQRFGGMFPPGSTWWVNPQDLAKYYESDCGTLEETVICCRGDSPDVPVVGLFLTQGDVFCLPDIATGQDLPRGQYKAVGLWSPYEELIGRQTPPDPAMRNISAIILDSVVMVCHKPSCCDPAYAPGDRVKLLVNQPGGAQGLTAGTGGTVLCCNPDDAITPILVSWDDWTGGGDADKLCQTRPDGYRENSAIWMACTEIKRVVKPDLCDKPEYRRFLPQTIDAGKHLKISGMIYNSGGAKSGSFTIEIYLSKDNQITRDDYRLSRRRHGPRCRGVDRAFLAQRASGHHPGGHVLRRLADRSGEQSRRGRRDEQHGRHRAGHADCNRPMMALPSQKAEKPDAGPTVARQVRTATYRRCRTAA